MPEHRQFGRALTLLLGLMALAGCDGGSGSWFKEEPEPQATFAIDPESGEFSAQIPTEDGTATIRSGENTAVSLPLGFSLYPGAQITDNTVVAINGSSGALVTFTASEEPQAIADYYRKQAEAAGIAIDFELSANGGEMIGGKGRNGAIFSLNVSRSDDVSEGQLMVQQPDGR